MSDGVYLASELVTMSIESLVGAYGVACGDEAQGRLLDVGSAEMEIVLIDRINKLSKVADRMERDAISQATKDACKKCDGLRYVASSSGVFPCPRCG